MATKSNGNGGSRERQVEDRELPVKLSETELLERGEKMAESELAIEQLQGERTVLTRKINDHKKERAQLAHVIESGEEKRQIKCTWHEDFNKNVFRLKRQDTGEEVDTRPMTALDRTGKLFDASNGNGTTEAEAVPPPRSPKPRAAKAKRLSVVKPANA